MLQMLRSGRNMGRKIFGALLLMAVISVFIRFSLLSHHMEVVGEAKGTEGRLLILKSYKDDWAAAQQAVTENQASNSMPQRVLERERLSESEPSTMFKRLLERSPVRQSINSPILEVFNFIKILCIFHFFHYLFGCRESSGRERENVLMFLLLTFTLKN